MRKIFLPDINFWLALAFDSQANHSVAREWLATTMSDSLAFCRVTQMGVLRLATNASAFPHDAVTMDLAWILYDQIRADRRVVFEHEPFGMEQHWRGLTQRPSRSPHLWADAYLAAFAQAGDFEIVTFDRGFTQYKNLRRTILS